jgi:hypothetical protein
MFKQKTKTKVESNFSLDEIEDSLDPASAANKRFEAVVEAAFSVSGVNIKAFLVTNSAAQNIMSKYIASKLHIRQVRSYCF